MAVTISDYTQNTTAVWDASSDSHPAKVDLPATHRGLIIIGGWADDERIVEPDPANQPDFATNIPYLWLTDGLAPLVGIVDTTVPYNFQSYQGGGKKNQRFFAISDNLPAIFARLGIFVAGEGTTFEPRAFSERDDGTKAMQRLSTVSYDANLSAETDEEIRKFTYRYSKTQPFIDIQSTNAFARMDVEQDDLVIFAASDTNANADTIAISSSGVTIQNLFDERYDKTYTDSGGNTHKVGSVLRVDRIKSAGELTTTFQDVTGALQAYRLVPVIELKDDPDSSGNTYTDVTSYTADMDLAYFQIEVPVTASLEPVYPKWMLDLLSRESDSGALGLVGNWPEGVEGNNGNIPAQWQEIQIWALDKSKLNFTNIPSGEAEVFPDRDAMESRRELLNKQL